ncbi:hypothetical protein F4775DRAFT_185756 [Biscogniauxia sp. FL1348]|nr:hypothetical protein F4775DRAFT_185756 [Biscogniauxia sp. FL1348]
MSLCSRGTAARPGEITAASWPCSAAASSSAWHLLGLVRVPPRDSQRDRQWGEEIRETTYFIAYTRAVLCAITVITSSHLLAKVIAGGEVSQLSYVLPGRTSPSPDSAKKHANRFNKSSYPLHSSFRSLHTSARSGILQTSDMVPFAQGCNLLAGPVLLIESVVCRMLLCLIRKP